MNRGKPLTDEFFGRNSESTKHNQVHGAGLVANTFHGAVLDRENEYFRRGAGRENLRAAFVSMQIRNIDIDGVGGKKGDPQAMAETSANGFDNTTARQERAEQEDGQEPGGAGHLLL